MSTATSIQFTLVARPNGAPTSDETGDPALALLQQHQASQISDQMIRAAESRLSAALDEASRGRSSSSSLLLRQLATDLGISKSGVQALFGSKENLQLAAVEVARETFLAEVVGPASAAPRGLARLRALVESWISYAESPLYPGGCFRAANLPEFDSRPGPVRDALARDVGAELLVRRVQDSIDRGRCTEETGPHASRNALQSVTLLDALAELRADAAIGGGRRDEEKARAKERD